MFKGARNKKILILTLILSISVFFFTGCMEAGAADWIGAPQPTEEEEEEPSTEEASTETVGEVKGGDKEVENDLPSYDPEELEEDYDEDIFEEEENDEDEEEEEEVSDNTISEDAVSENVAEDTQSDDGENHDVTKGSWDGSDWTAEATIGENHEIKVTVNATKSAMQHEHVTDYTPAAKKMGKNIDDLRFAFYRKVEGSKSAAADVVADYEDIDEMEDKQMDSLLSVADDLGKLIAQFGITGYDFEHPAENDEDEITMDLYRKSNYQYFMYLKYDGSHLKEINLELQEY